MPAFEYIALDSAGRRSRGLIEGDTDLQVRQQLRASGLTPLSLRSVADRQRQPRRFSARVGIGALTLFTRQFAGLLQSGLPIDEALDAVAGQSESHRLGRLLKGLRTRVQEGDSLTGALEAYPRAFPPLYRATVAAGEQSRELPAVLEQLADYLEAQHAIAQRTLSALIYPVILVTASLLIVAGLLTYVVPEVVKIFANTGQTLPLITRLLIGVSDWLRAWGLLLLGAMAAAALAISHLLRREGPLLRVHQALLRTPLLGRLWRRADAARFDRTLAILLRSGVPLLEALPVAAAAVRNRVMRRAVLAAADLVREGTSLHRALDEQSCFPPLTLHLIASGEAGSNLEQMLDTAARSHEREVASLTTLLLGLLEPAIILLLGGFVLAIVVAILLPIFELNQMV
ncbi:MAG: type II secretion system inner membrane protein GspF [Pseudomonadota bacterium]|nr:type II secretion system inner membrane protein GspF [Pseudomonadota bacterium]